MKATLSRTLWTHVACLSLWPVFLLAGTPDPVANLSACKKGWSTCERSHLTASELTEVARADHARNVVACRRGAEECDLSGLGPAEAVALAVAEHDRNVSSCTDGIGACDQSALTPAEARDVAMHPRYRTVRRVDPHRVGAG